MLKKLLGRHRSLRVGATIVGASALAIGVASPAFAAQNVNNGNADNANAQNYVVVEGGAQASYQLMLAESDIFNEAPGCDLLSVSGSAQPLDYGCPGLNGEAGVPQPPATTVQFTGVTVTSGSKKLALSSNSGVVVGDQLTDSQGVIPVGDPIASLKGSTKIKLKFAAKGNSTGAGDTITVNTVPQSGEDGYTTWGNENPFNDFLLQEPSYGSGNGIQELEGTGSASVVGHSANTDDPVGIGPVAVAPLDAARSSRAPKLTSSGDFQGLNFVAYAEDAVSYLYWPEYNGASTDAAKCINQIGATNITTGELKLVWNETYSAGGTPSETWNSVFGCTTNGSSNPIEAYWALNNTGTESTWATTTGATFPGASSNWPSKQIIFENETSSILKNAKTVPIGDVLFFFSYGNFNKNCLPNASELSTATGCAGTSTTSTANSVQLGTTLNGINLNQADINNQLPGLEGSAFPGDRLLYNVYADGENPNIPASAPAALNAVSEDGFLCKPATATDIDPNTGETYRSEIDAVITGEGFFPLPNLQVEDGQGDTSIAAYNSTEAGIPNPAWHDGLSASKYNAANETGSPWNFAAADVDTDNSAVNGTYTNVEDGSSTLGTFTASASQPVGYCITETSDSSTAGQ
jgi:hypothetical protein